jgi:hypothetical protein
VSETVLEGGDLNLDNLRLLEELRPALEAALA